MVSVGLSEQNTFSGSTPEAHRVGVLCDLRLVFVAREIPRRPPWETSRLILKAIVATPWTKTT